MAPIPPDRAAAAEEKRPFYRAARERARNRARGSSCSGEKDARSLEDSPVNCGHKSFTRDPRRADDRESSRNQRADASTATRDKTAVTKEGARRLGSRERKLWPIFAVVCVSTEREGGDISILIKTENVEKLARRYASSRSLYISLRNCNIIINYGEKRISRILPITFD